MSDILALANVESSYGPIRAIRGVSLAVKKGQIATVLGSNGAGKTTILKTISGIIDPRKGSIEFKGNDITARDPALIVQQGLSHVPEGREVFPLLSVRDNLMMGAYTRRDRDGVARDMETVYGYFPILRERASDQSLQVVGQLPNTQRPAAIGLPGEQVYAVRMLGERGYVVTFRQVDPLYVLDLSNPADPKQAGELKVPGFSDYLFPMGDGLLFGVGKDADASGRQGGVKVALFDVKDPARPAALASLTFGQRGSATALDASSHGINLFQRGSVMPAGEFIGQLSREGLLAADGGDDGAHRRLARPKARQTHGTG